MDAQSHTPGHVASPVVVLDDGTGGLSDRARAWIADRAAAAIGYLGAAGEVRVRVVNDSEMSAAHKEFLEIDGTTDVITFDMSEPGPGGSAVLDADLLICLDEASRQAGARGHDAERELLLYVVHGVLHCLGYDDHDEEQYAAMHAREDEVLRAIGVGATFATEPRGGGA